MVFCLSVLLTYWPPFRFEGMLFLLFGFTSESLPGWLTSNFPVEIKYNISILSGLKETILRKRELKNFGSTNFKAHTYRGHWVLKEE